MFYAPKQNLCVFVLRELQFIPSDNCFAGVWNNNLSDAFTRIAITAICAVRPRRVNVSFVFKNHSAHAPHIVFFVFHARRVFLRMRLRHDPRKANYRPLVNSAKAMRRHIFSRICTLAHLRKSSVFIRFQIPDARRRPKDEKERTTFKNHKFVSSRSSCYTSGLGAGSRNWSIARVCVVAFRKGRYHGDIKAATLSLRPKQAFPTCPTGLQSTSTTQLWIDNKLYKKFTNSQIFNFFLLNFWMIRWNPSLGIFYC